MKVNELRIGNWIKYKDKLMQVVQLSSLMILCQRDENQFLVNCAPKEFQPIELTEELMLKIGFKKDGNNYSLVCDDIEVGFYIDKFKQVLYINVSREKRFYKNELRSYDVKYLHQLQNAYYLLTNEELKVEL